MRIGKNSVVIGLLFTGLVLVNYLASTVPARIDATSDRIFTLSPGTRSLLAKIEEPMVLDFYYTRSVPGMPIAYKNYADRVQEMIREYARASRGRITFNIVDPKPDTPEQERATAAGLSSQVVRSGGDPFQFGLVATQADQQKVIAVFDPNREQFLEYDLSHLLYSVQQFDRKKVGLISSMPLQGMPATQVTRAQESQIVIEEWESSYQIVPVSASARDIPDGLDVLAIIHPQSVSAEMQYAIDQFILSGKPVFLAVDPVSYFFRQQGRNTPVPTGLPPNVTSDLPALFDAYGIAFNPDKVVGDSENAKKLVYGNVPVQSSVWLALTKPNFNKQAMPTAQINSLLFPEAGYLQAKAGATTTFTPLVQTSDKAGEVDGLAVQFTTNPEDINRLVKPMAMKTIAALVTGKFHTAFPDGPPKPDSADPNAAMLAPVAPKGDPLKESKTSSTLLVVADSDWLLDYFSVQQVQSMFGQGAVTPINDNIAFASNILEFLGGSNDLISIRGKGSSIRPFDVVQAMEADANRKYGEKMTELQKRRTEVQTKLSELQSRTSGSGALTAPPEVTRAIEDFRKQQAAVSAETRQIKRAFREDIDALENKLLAINLLASPLLVCAFGILFYRKRRKS